MRLPLPTHRAMLAAASGAAFGFGVATALAGRRHGPTAAPADLDDPIRPARMGGPTGLAASEVDGMELDALLGNFELEVLLGVVGDVELEDLLRGDLERS